ncbi:unnamed protein product [Rangifer tarandus platyrhynchus]|uniref:Uncharacterized protein n=1 Tax=Rangifer tarandus platyrhynchus TaxID=3082113 RepID=A0ABN8Y4T5_RANTA|nr:unnamed protein product [Rangifer tarandus platyrhynchus]
MTDTGYWGEEKQRGVERPFLAEERETQEPGLSRSSAGGGGSGGGNGGFQGVRKPDRGLLSAHRGAGVLSWKEAHSERHAITLCFRMTRGPRAGMPPQKEAWCQVMFLPVNPAPGGRPADYFQEETMLAVTLTGILQKKENKYMFSQH